MFIAKVGLYQLENLKRQRVGFYCFDLSSQKAPGLAVIEDRTMVDLGSVLPHLQSLGLATQAPIILVDEDGSKAEQAAKLLEENSYINVFVIEGGTRALLEELRDEV